jgi:hypothetical protein
VNGCAKQPNIVVVCDELPLPSKKVLINIYSLKDEEINLWMKNLLILKKKLDINCKYKQKDKIK